jgi:hypothetical protein
VQLIRCDRWPFEVVRTIEDRRVIYIAAEHKDTARGLAKDHAEWKEVRAPWSGYCAHIGVAGGTEIDKPPHVDVLA